MKSRIRSSSPTRYKSRLQITVVEAKNLHPKEKSALSKAWGNSVTDAVGSVVLSDDPYCKVTLGNKTYKTTTKSNTLAPKWNETFQFENFEANSEIKIVLRDSLTIGKGHFFGELLIPLSSLKKNEEYEEWFALSKRKGIPYEISASILLKIFYSPRDESLPEGTSNVDIVDTVETPESSLPNSIIGGLSSLKKKIEGKLETVIKHESEDEVEQDKTKFIEGILHSSVQKEEIQPLSRQESKDVLLDDLLPRPGSSPPTGEEHLGSSDEKEDPEMKEKDNLIDNTLEKLSGILATTPVIRNLKLRSNTGGLESPKQLSPPDSRRASSAGPAVDEKVDLRKSITKETEKALEVKRRNESYQKKFDLPATETLLKVISTALHKQILIHGRLYISENYICFHSNIFGLKTTEIIEMGEIIDIKKTFRSLSLGIQITTHNNKYNFASFFWRDKAFNFLIKTWKLKDKAGIKEILKEDGENIYDEEEDEDAYLSTKDDDPNDFLQSSADFTQVADEQFPVSVIKFFRLFFADPNWTAAFRKERGDTEITVKEWTSHPQYGNVRELQYRASTGQPIGPSTARCEETQRYHLTKTRLTVEAVSVMYDIPYGDHFRVEMKWEVTSDSPQSNSCHLSVFMGVHFLKKTWFKAKIESGAQKESKASTAQWVALARKEILKMAGKKSSSKIDKDEDSKLVQSGEKELQPSWIFRQRARFFQFLWIVSFIVSIYLLHSLLTERILLVLLLALNTLGILYINSIQQRMQRVETTLTSLTR